GWGDAEGAPRPGVEGGEAAERGGARADHARPGSVPPAHLPRGRLLEAGVHPGADQPPGDHRGAQRAAGPGEGERRAAAEQPGAGEVLPVVRGPADGAINQGEVRLLADVCGRVGEDVELGGAAGPDGDDPHDRPVRGEADDGARTRLPARVEEGVGEHGLGVGGPRGGGGGERGWQAGGGEGLGEMAWGAGGPKVGIASARLLPIGGCPSQPRRAAGLGRCSSTGGSCPAGWDGAGAWACWDWADAGSGTARSPGSAGSAGSRRRDRAVSATSTVRAVAGDRWSAGPPRGAPVGGEVGVASCKSALSDVVIGRAAVTVRAIVGRPSSNSSGGSLIAGWGSTIATGASGCWDPCARAGSCGRSGCGCGCSPVAACGTCGPSASWNVGA